LDGASAGIWVKEAKVIRQILGLGFLGSVLLLAWGCGQKGARLQKSVVPPDRTLFETGEEYRGKHQYIKARLAFQTLINTYPDSEMTADAYMSIGDSFYDEGGTGNLLQAEDQYKNFIIFFPTHPKAADAQLKIISANMRMMRAPDRDQKFTVRAEEAIKRFEMLFPESDYIPIIEQYMDEVQESLAWADFGVGKFYSDRGNMLGARSRFQEIPEKYVNFSEMDEVYWALGNIMEMVERSDEAAIYYGRIAEGYPFSKRFEGAKLRLDDMGKPLPAVDEVLAAQNESKLKPSEGFSPLKPFVSFVQALGFVPPPDRYEEAVEKLAAMKGEKDARVAEGVQTSDNVLIEATLEKDASGKTVGTAVLGSNPKGKQPASDKEDDKKKDSKKDKKKTTKKKPL